MPPFFVLGAVIYGVKTISCHHDSEADSLRHKIPIDAHLISLFRVLRATR